MTDLSKSIALAVKTGKVLFGAKNTQKNVKTGKVRLIVAASNCPQKFHKDTKYYCKLSRIPLIVYDGTSKDLGIVCGKPYAVSVLAVREPGDSDILKVAESG